MKKISLFDLSVFMILLLVSLLCLMPLMNTLAMSLSDKTSAAAGKVILLPHNVNISAYKSLLSDRQYWRSFLNSLKRVAL